VRNVLSLSLGGVGRNSKNFILDHPEDKTLKEEIK
jgi:hypothetical protein